MGDIEAVFGSDEFHNDISEDDSWSTKIRLWLQQRKRGYLPIRQRREMLVKHLDRITSGRLPV